MSIVVCLSDVYGADAASGVHVVVWWTHTLLHCCGVTLLWCSRPPGIRTVTDGGTSCAKAHLTLK